MLEGSKIIRMKLKKNMFFLNSPPKLLKKNIYLYIIYDCFTATSLFSLVLNSVSFVSNFLLVLSDDFFEFSLSCGTSIFVSLPIVSITETTNEPIKLINNSHRIFRDPIPFLFSSFHFMF